MLVEAELADFTPEKETLLSIGVFDGVHLGHKHLISTLTGEAKRRGLLAGVVTFRTHPQEFFSPSSRLVCLTQPDERIKLLKDEGVDFVVPLTFDADLASLSAREFVDLLKKYLKMRGLVIGPDFALGKGREGTTGFLAALGQEKGFTVTVVPPLTVKGEVISSTAIRNALAAGDLQKVAKLSGRPFALHGKVVTGAGRGASLGYPTANLTVDASKALPADGVYASRTSINGDAYQSLTNIGTCPTFGACERTVESFLLGYKGDLYGRDLRIDFISKLRDEKKFTSIEELKKQIAEDVARGKAILAKG